MRFESIDPGHPIEIGDETTYNISVANQGFDDDLNVDVMVKLPRGMCFMEGSGDSEVRAHGQIIRFQRVRRLRPGHAVNWRIVLRAESDTDGQLEVSMVSDATRPEPETGGDSGRVNGRAHADDWSSLRRSSTTPQFGNPYGRSF